MLKLVLIGAGSHSHSSHAPSLAEYKRKHPGRVELTAVCDLDEKKARFFQQEFGFRKYYLNFEEMFAGEQPDGCICVMPVHRVVEIGIRLLKLSVPILLEKPPGASIEEARRLSAVAGSSETPNMVSVNRRFDPCLCRGLEWAKKQGPFRHVHAVILRHQRHEPEFVWATAFHCVDALRKIAGEVTGYKVMTMPGAKSTWFQLDLTFQDGTSGHLDVFPGCGCTEEKYEIFGEDFRAEIYVGNCSQPRTRCWLAGELVVDETLPADLPGFIRGGSYAETGEFITALLEGRAPRPSIKEVLQSAEICFACTRDSSQ